jgi:heme/copper-type cytochrome/quinol oxidase subunit 3
METVSLKAPRLKSPFSDGVLGMLIFVAMEVMFFAGFISAFTITKAGAAPGMWPPPNQPVLPAAQTALNTFALLSSAACLFAAQRSKASGKPAQRLLLGTWLLGGLFVALQGKEWLALLSQGLTLTSSKLGAFFYLIVGAHGLHALAALGGLVAVWLQSVRGRLSDGFLNATAVFWYFVVLIWPVIYGRVYF